MRSGGVHSATLPTAADSLVTALPRDGTEPWPAGPRAMSSTKRGSFSVVPMLAWRTCAAGPHHAAAFGEAVLGADRIEMVVGHELRADVGRAFLAGFRQQDHVAIERRRCCASG